MTVTNMTPDILLMRTDKGTLPYHAWPGGYPLYYMDADGNILCPTCANANDEFDKPITACDANWEDASLYCDHCSERIESAYAEDDHA